MMLRATTYSVHDDSFPVGSSPRFLVSITIAFTLIYGCALVHLYLARIPIPFRFASRRFIARLMHAIRVGYWNRQCLFHTVSHVTANGT